VAAKNQLRSIGFWQAYTISMSRIIITFFTAFIFSGASMTGSATPQATAVTPLISFQSPEEARAWRTVNDDVMGGRSLGKSVVEGGQLLFIGVIDTNGGGFSSIRREMEPGALEEARAIILSVKPDGRSYKLIAQTNARFRGRYVSYQAPIPTSPAGEWSDVRIAFSDFVPSVFGRIVSASEFSPAKVTQLGFIIADDVDGDFALSVRSISTEG
jgi:NADH dehydrogenase [ubiquinone] 1 alpha subcomplex assembly factor 1